MQIIRTAFMHTTENSSMHGTQNSNITKTDQFFQGMLRESVFWDLDSSLK